MAIWLVFTLLLHVTSRRTQPAINRNYARIFSLSVEFPEGGQTGIVLPVLNLLAYLHMLFVLNLLYILYIM